VLEAAAAAGDAVDPMVAAAVAAGEAAQQQEVDNAWQLLQEVQVRAGAGAMSVGICTLMCATVIDRLACVGCTRASTLRTLCSRLGLPGETWGERCAGLPSGPARGDLAISLTAGNHACCCHACCHGGHWSHIRYSSHMSSPASVAVCLYVCWRVRCCAQELLNTAVKHDVVVVVPCMPSPPPRIDAPEDVHQSWLYRCHAFAALTALGGVPSVVVPLGQIQQGAGPAAVAAFGHGRSDTRLITVAERLTQTARVGRVTHQGGGGKRGTRLGARAMGIEHRRQTWDY
jgi:hypothetical protein